MGEQYGGGEEGEGGGYMPPLEATPSPGPGSPAGTSAGNHHHHNHSHHEQVREML